MAESAHQVRAGQGRPQSAQRGRDASILGPRHVRLAGLADALSRGPRQARLAQLAADLNGGRPTPINTDAGLEREAGQMGALARQGPPPPSERLSAPPPRSSPVQLKQVPVSGGVFEDELYRADNGGGKLRTAGAQMSLKFSPYDFIPAKEVSLVQTTNSDIQNLDDPAVADQPESLLNERRTRSGSAVDQQIYGQTKDHRPTRINNLDPRYHEARLSVAEPLAKSARAGGGNAATEYTQHEKLDAGGVTDRWRPARLKDQPGHTYRPGERLVGREGFEVAALADGEDYLGSVAWGYKIEAGKAVLDPETISLVNYGAASADFFEAAERWNALRVRDPQTGQAHAVIQLPTLASVQRLKAKGRMSMWLKAVLTSYPNAQQEHFDQLTDRGFGVYLLTGGIPAWDRGAGPGGDNANLQSFRNLVFKDLFSVYPQGDQYVGQLTADELSEFITTGAIQAWDRL